MIKSAEPMEVANRRDEAIVSEYDGMCVTSKDVWRCFYC